MNLNRVFGLMAFASTSIFFASCSTDGCTDNAATNYNADATSDDGSCEYEVNYLDNLPTTYDFENVDFSGQSQRIAMLAELTDYMKTANTSGVSIDSSTLSKMFSNSGYTWSNASLNGLSKQLKDKTYSGDHALYERWFGEIALASQSTVAGSNGQAGVVVSRGGTVQYLFDANGFEHIQLIEKGLFGSLLFYQAASVYLEGDKMNVDNTTVQAGQGTAMQHHFDEAFGYFGVPQSGFADATQLKVWARYCNSRNVLMNTNSIMDDFIKGRAAINNNDLTTRDAAIAAIREKWELVTVGTAMNYLNRAIADITDDAIRNHVLSEAYAFIMAIKYSPVKKLTNQQIDEILALFGDNLYTIAVGDINAIKDRLAQAYGLENIKNQL